MNGYVRDHLPVFEKALFSGVPYQTLVGATLVAGFRTATPRSIETAVYRARRKRRLQPAHQVPHSIVPTARTAVSREVSPHHLDDGDVTVAIGRRFRQLVRPPKPRTDEPDLLI